MLDTATIPMTQPQQVGRPGDPCVMVIFGAAGDLTRRKLDAGLIQPRQAAATVA